MKNVLWPLWEVLVICFIFIFDIYICCITYCVCMHWVSLLTLGIHMDILLNQWCNFIHYF